LSQSRTTAPGSFKGGPSRRLGAAIVIGLLITLGQIGLAVLICDKHGLEARWSKGLFQWDSIWFTGVAEHGYQRPAQLNKENPGNFAFLPSYPIWGRIVARATGLEMHDAMIVAAELCCWGFWAYFLLFLMEWQASLGVGAFAVGLIVLHPASFFLIAAYSEALFMFCMFGQIYWLDRRGRMPLLLAGLHGFVMTASRIVAVALVVYPLVRSIIYRIGRPDGAPLPPHTSWGSVLATMLMSAAGFGGFLGYCQWEFGDWRWCFTSGRVGWGVEPNFLAIFDPDVYYRSVTNWHEWPLDPNVLSAVCAGCMFLALIGVGVAEAIHAQWGTSPHMRWRLGVYACAVILFYVPYSSHSGIGLKCFSRFSVPALALLCLGGSQLALESDLRKRRWLRWLLGALIVLGGMANALMTMRFTSDQWVADRSIPATAPAHETKRHARASAQKAGNSTWPLTAAVNDAPARQVIWRNLDLHAVARDDANEVLAHAAGNVSDHFSADVELDAELRVGERLLDSPFDFDCFFFCHNVGRPHFEKRGISTTTDMGPTAMLVAVNAKQYRSPHGNRHYRRKRAENNPQPAPISALVNNGARDRENRRRHRRRSRDRRRQPGAVRAAWPR
jgi:hypothetical protein